MTPIDDVIATFASSHDLATNRLDPDGCLTMPLPSGLDMMLSHLPADNALVFYCELGTPMGDSATLHRKLLEGMHVWRASGGVAFGLVPGSEMVSASLLVPVNDRFDAAVLSRAIEHFDDVVTTWSEIVLAQDEDLPGDAAPLAEDPGRNPQAPFIKV